MEDLGSEFLMRVGLKLLSCEGSKQTQKELFFCFILSCSTQCLTVFISLFNLVFELIKI